MMTFREYLRETVVASKRSNMIHFQDMKAIEFVEFVRSIKTTMKGKLHNLKTEMKVDGLGARFGKDSSGRIFFEGSRTGPIFDDGAFSAFARNKGSAEEIVLRAVHYDDLLGLFKKADFMKLIPNNRKVIAEIFYNPMAQEDETGITFVTVKYDKTKLGSLMTLMPHGVIEADTGLPASDEKEILKNLISRSSESIKILSPSLKMGTIDIQGIINPIDAITDSDVRVLGSRTKADATAKQNLLAIIEAVKNELAIYILDHPEITDKFKLGPNIEGLVLYINGKVFKITTPDFKAAIREKKTK